MQTLLNTHDDAELRSEQQMQQLMEVLDSRERDVIQMLYGSSAAELLQAAEASSGEKKGCWESRSSGWAKSATSAAGVGPRKAGKKAPNGSRQAVIKGAVPLAAVAEQFGLTVERTRQVRMSALRKLQAAAAAQGLVAGGAADGSAAASAELSLLPDEAANAAAAAAADPAVVQAAINACKARTQPMLQSLHRYYLQRGRVPAADVSVGGRHLGKWCSRQYELYKQKELSQELVDVFQLVAPGWLPKAAGTKQQQHQQQMQPVQQHEQETPAASSLGQGQERLLRLRQQRQRANDETAAAHHSQGSAAPEDADQQQLQQLLQHEHQLPQLGQQEQQQLEQQQQAVGVLRTRRRQPQQPEHLQSALAGALPDQPAPLAQQQQQLQSQQGQQAVAAPPSRHRQQPERRKQSVFSSRVLALQQFIAEQQRFPSISSLAPAHERTLGWWVVNMRRHRRNGRLGASQIAALDAVPGFEWSAKQGRPRYQSSSAAAV
jgi:hypothetical protein